MRFSWYQARCALHITPLELQKGERGEGRQGQQHLTHVTVMHPK